MLPEPPLQPASTKNIVIIRHIDLQCWDASHFLLDRCAAEQAQAARLRQVLT